MTNPVFDDAIGTGWITNVSSTNTSKVCTGSNLFLGVWVATYNSASLITVSSITYGAASLTKDKTITATLTSAFQDFEFWYLDGVAAGSATLTINLSGTTGFLAYFAASYSGKTATGIAASTAVQNTSAASASPACNVTAPYSDCLLIGAGYSRYAGAPTAGASTTLRKTTTVGHIDGDGNGVMSADAETLNFNVGTASTWPGVICAAISGANAPFAPVAHKLFVGQAVNRAAVY